MQTRLLSALLCIVAACLFRNAYAQGAPAASPTLVRLRSASIVLKVPYFKAAQRRVNVLSEQHQAVLTRARIAVDPRGRKHGDIILRMRTDQLDSMLRDVRGTEKLYSESVQTNDMTSEYETLQRRIEILAQNEADLLVFLHRPGRMRGSDVLFVQYRLFQTRLEAADAAQNRANLARGAQYSTLNVTLFEPPTSPVFNWHEWHLRAVQRGKLAFLARFRRFLAAVYILAFTAPFWLPVLLVLWLLYRWFRPRVRGWLAGLRQQAAGTSPE